MKPSANQKLMKTTVQEVREIPQDIVDSRLPQNHLVVVVQLFSHVWLFAIPWTVASLTPLSMGFFKARILEWVAITFSRGSSWSRDQTHISCKSPALQVDSFFFLTTEPPGKPPKFLTALFPMSLQYKGQNTVGSIPQSCFSVHLLVSCITQLLWHLSLFTCSLLPFLSFTFPLHWSLLPLSLLYLLPLSLLSLC